MDGCAEKKKRKKKRKSDLHLNEYIVCVQFQNGEIRLQKAHRKKETETRIFLKIFSKMPSKAFDNNDDINVSSFIMQGSQLWKKKRHERRKLFFRRMEKGKGRRAGGEGKQKGGPNGEGGVGGFGGNHQEEKELQQQKQKEKETQDTQGPIAAGNGRDERDRVPITVYILAVLQIQRVWRGIIQRRRLMKYFANLYQQQDQDIQDSHSHTTRLWHLHEKIVLRVWREKLTKKKQLSGSSSSSSSGDTSGSSGDTLGQKKTNEGRERDPHHQDQSMPGGGPRPPPPPSLQKLIQNVRTRMRTVLIRNEFDRWCEYDRFAIYYVAATTIKKCWNRFKQYGSSLEYSSSTQHMQDGGRGRRERRLNRRLYYRRRFPGSPENQAAARLQDCWHRHVCRRIYGLVRDTLRRCEGMGVKTLLRLIGSSDCYMADEAFGLHARLRLGAPATSWSSSSSSLSGSSSRSDGLSPFVRRDFPPVLYVKVFTHNNVADVGAFAPKNYQQERQQRPPSLQQIQFGGTCAGRHSSNNGSGGGIGGHQHTNRKSGTRKTTMSQSQIMHEHQQSMRQLTCPTGWYQRLDHNPWLPIPFERLRVINANVGRGRGRPGPGRGGSSRQTASSRRAAACSSGTERNNRDQQNENDGRLLLPLLSTTTTAAQRTEKKKKRNSHRVPELMFSTTTPEGLNMEELKWQRFYDLRWERIQEEEEEKKRERERSEMVKRRETRTIGTVCNNDTNTNTRTNTSTSVVSNSAPNNAPSTTSTSTQRPTPMTLLSLLYSHQHLSTPAVVKALERQLLCECMSMKKVQAFSTHSNSGGGGRGFAATTGGNQQGTSSSSSASSSPSSYLSSSPSSLSSSSSIMADAPFHATRQQRRQLAAVRDKVSMRRWFVELYSGEEQTGISSTTNSSGSSVSSSASLPLASRDTTVTERINHLVRRKQQRRDQQQQLCSHCSDGNSNNNTNSSSTSSSSSSSSSYSLPTLVSVPPPPGSTSDPASYRRQRVKQRAQALIFGHLDDEDVRREAQTLTQCGNRHLNYTEYRRDWLRTGAAAATATATTAQTTTASER